MDQIDAKLAGTVVRVHYSPGSKSDHMAVMLDTPKGRYKLRLPGGGAFVDPELDKMVGQEIEGVGNVTGNLFILKNWTVAPRR